MLDGSQNYDVERALNAYGIFALNEFTEAAVVDKSLSALAEYAQTLSDSQRELLKARAVSALKAQQVPGGPSALVKLLKQTARRQKSRAREIAWEDLPPGVLAGTDLATAYLVREKHGDRLRHVTQLGGLYYTGSHWLRDDGDVEVRRAVHAVACTLEVLAGRQTADAGSAAERGDDDGASNHRTIAKAAREWAQTAQHSNRIAATIRELRVLDGIATDVDSLDTDPLALACPNATLNLATGKPREHRRDDLITRCTGVAFDERAPCPVFEQTLARVLPDPEVRAFLQRYAGYSLTGVSTEQCLTIFWGPGANGKSTILEGLRFALGDYASNTSTDTLMFDRGRRGPQNDIARLRGARMVTAAESGEGRRLDEELVKRLTGGDRITARFLFKEHFEFEPSFKLWLAVNDRPEIRGIDLGIWRRMRLVHFGVTISPEEQDHNLGAKLRAEAPGILAWAVRGCLDWQQTGLRAPPAVIAATDAWRSESNIVAEFVDERCALSPHAKQTSGSLYAAFTDWARSQGADPMDVRAFGKRLAALGYQASRSNDARYWLGLALRNTEDLRCPQ